MASHLVAHERRDSVFTVEVNARRGLPSPPRGTTSPGAGQQLTDRGFELHLISSDWLR